MATDLLEQGLAAGTVLLSHQAILEFVAATSRSIAGGPSLLSPAEARQEADELLSVFPVLYPTAGVVRTALRGAALYGLSSFDAHVWAYAEHFGLDTLFSEDFQDGALLGGVRIVDPFPAR